ncbi:MAG: response regulator [candidate division NC10 bacterium]|nr:response regulator [candidate division NC10 bacterium]
MSRAPAPDPPVVLIVDDEAGLRHLARQILQRGGYGTLEAADGVEALAILSAPPSLIALVLTDVRMPKMNGLELERVVHQRWPGLPVLLMSGEITKEWVSETLGTRALDIIRKPFLGEHLLEMVHDLLHSPTRSTLP